MMYIRAIETRDFSTVANLQAAAFSRDELFNWLYPSLKDYPYTFRHDWLHRLRKRVVEPSLKCLVAENDGDVVGCAVWNWRGDKADAANWTSDALWKSKLWTCGSPNSELMKTEIDRQLLNVESKYWDFINPALSKKALANFMASTNYEFFDQLASDGFLHLSSLAVNPKHQGKGIGKALVQWGMNVAAEHQIPVTLEASVTGRHMYAKQGFVLIAKHDIIDGPEGFDGIAMMWEPTALRGKWLEYEEDGKWAKIKKID